MPDSSKMSASQRQQRKEQGIAYVLLQRLNNERLPMALDLKKRVDRGELLSNFDRMFLKRVLAESGEVRRYVLKHPEYEGLMKQMTELYDEITRKGMENEKNPPPTPRSDATDA